MFRGEITPDEAKVMVAVLEAEDAAYRRENDYQGRLALHQLTFDIYRPELERRLAEAERQSAALRAELDADADADLHSACMSGADPIPSPRGEREQGHLHSACISESPGAPDPVMPGLDPGIMTGGAAWQLAPPSRWPGRARP
jgi:hypothetical protein